MKEFELGAFALHLVEVAVKEEIALRAGLRKCAEAIESTAKSEIGHYQPEVAYFPAWEQLAPQTLKFHESMGVGDSPLMVTGELYASIDHTVSGFEAAIGSTSDIMVYQELGTDRIPPRPVLGPAAIRNHAKIAGILGAAAAEGILYGAQGAGFARLQDEVKGKE